MFLQVSLVISYLFRLLAQHKSTTEAGSSAMNNGLGHEEEILRNLFPVSALSAISAWDLQEKGWAGGVDLRNCSEMLKSWFESWEITTDWLCVFFLFHSRHKTSVHLPCPRPCPISFAYHVAANERTFFPQKREAGESHHRSDRSMTLVAAESYLCEIVENKSHRLNPEFLHENESVVEYSCGRRPTTWRTRLDHLRRLASERDREVTAFPFEKYLTVHREVFTHFLQSHATLLPTKRPPNERRSSRAATAYMKSCDLFTEITERLEVSLKNIICFIFDFFSSINFYRSRIKRAMALCTWKGRKRRLSSIRWLRPQGKIQRS